jgi:hypothetical protein
MAAHDVASNIRQTLGRGVTRSKRQTLQWTRKAAENGRADACLHLAGHMYGDQPYAREVGHVSDAAGITTSAGAMWGHDVPTDVMTGVLHWLRQGGHDADDNYQRITSYDCAGGSVLPQQRVRGCGTSGGLHSLSAVQDRPVLWRRMSETGLDHGWAQGKVWQNCGVGCVTQLLRERRCSPIHRLASNTRVNARQPRHRCMVNGIICLRSANGII